MFVVVAKSDCVRCPKQLPVFQCSAKVKGVAAQCTTTNTTTSRERQLYGDKRLQQQLANSGSDTSSHHGDRWKLSAHFLFHLPHMRSRRLSQREQILISFTGQHFSSLSLSPSLLTGQFFFSAVFFYFLRGNIFLLSLYRSLARQAMTLVDSMYRVFLAC